MIDPDTVRRGTAAAAYVTQMTVLTALGGWLGRQLDARFDTEPALQLTGFVVGFALGMAALLFYLTRTPPDDDEHTPDPAE